ncbi:GlxA family transcriptional regulator [Methylocystis iwaonis]|uniref:Transcriptional regulator n=1 Tax=Methylocystis iwaonis TaxID=2885079 RepID=A0ABM8E3V6_9HYPH|nr:helix-turn-helix domain-containing protein [Methylocystis iwaonis]BDV32474.1 transcriptional regulator [Methylocystis iwaonis]
MDIAVLGYENCLGLGFIGAADLLMLSRRMLKTKERPSPYRVVTVSQDGAPICDGSGRTHAVDEAFGTLDSCAAIVVPPFFCEGGNSLPPTPEISAAAAWLRRQHALGAIVAAACNGVFLLGEAGLLDGRRCTTTWWRHDELKARYPRADAARGASLIEDRRVVTAGGPLSWIDLSLHLIRALVGDEAAKTAADFTVVDAAPSTQTIYIPPGHVSASNPFILQAEHIVRQAGDSPLTSVQLAQALGVSDRTLHRRLKEFTGETPKSFLDRVRFETARMLLETTQSSVKQLASASGYADETSFRRAFRRYAGMTPGAYRSWSLARRGVKA